jgi:hypothetical protein
MRNKNTRATEEDVALGLCALVGAGLAVGNRMGEPYLAVAEAGGRRYATINRPSPRSAKRYLALDTFGGTDLDLA